jgi:hypothetical protein
MATIHRGEEIGEIALDGGKYLRCFAFNEDPDSVKGKAETLISHGE